MGRVLVLGGTGFIGSEVVRGCREAGFEARAVARHAPDEWASDGPVELVVGEVEDPLLLDRALMDIDWVVHAVGCPPPAASTDDFDSAASAVLGLDTLLEALRVRPGVGLTFVSSGGAVYGDSRRLPVDEDMRCRPISAYGLGKLMAEDSIAAYSARYGIPARILRVANAYGPGQDASSGQGVIGAMLQAAIDGGSVPVFDGGRAVRDFVHVTDVTNAVVTLRPGRSEPQVVNVGSGVGHSIAQVVSIVEAVTGSDLQIRWLPRRPSDVREVVLDVTRLRKLMAWHPRMLEDGITQTWQDLMGVAESSPDQLSA
jgi:UDP-glucose 4-epimerase